ncbi:metal-sensitive transcriptional regulator [Alicyclobacillus sp. ALC3]|uniref:metal-sensitive transcriptional regulator n=1 Tax=Alicyclobacillus sp. ALC3 TaxID=2796143 RepID=UPI0023781180|nr:metal-sensitive transcriptional regulator [Alicyclobacillus sp. ALC3]
MIEEDDSNCVNILTQISSIHEALRGVGKEVMRKYLKTCATNAIQSGEDEVYDELMNVIYKYVK